MNTYNPTWIVFGVVAAAIGVGFGLGSDHVRAVGDWALLGGCVLGALALMRLADKV
jgi:hypothetical protein